MAQETLRKRIERPNQRTAANFDGIDAWYEEKKKTYTTEEWTMASRFIGDRVAARRKQSAQIRENSIRLRTGNTKSLNSKSIEVKNKFIGRKEEIEIKMAKLKVLKKKVDGELGLMHQAIKELDEFNKTRFAWPSKANSQCLRARSKRIGVDLVADDVDATLKTEKEMLDHVSEDLEAAFMKAVETAGMMQECSVSLGEDIDRKSEAALTENTAEKLKLTSAKVSLHVETLQAPPKDSVAYEEWKIATEDLEQRSLDLINESKELRKRMKQLQEESDLKVKSHELDVFGALRNRVEEYEATLREDRRLLTEVKHEISTVLDEVKHCIDMIHEQEKPIKRNTTRLRKREIGRASPERTVDAVHDTLLQEAKDIQATVDALQQEIDTHNANLADLREIEVILEEDLLIKSTSLKIENRCLYLRSYFNKFKSAN